MSVPSQGKAIANSTNSLNYHKCWENRTYRESNVNQRSLCKVLDNFMNIKVLPPFQIIVNSLLNNFLENLLVLCCLQALEIIHRASQKILLKTEHPTIKIFPILFQHCVPDTKIKCKFKIIYIHLTFLWQGSSTQPYNWKISTKKKFIPKK